MVPNAYNNNFQLFQSRNQVVILNEMIHDARVIPLDGRPHAPSNIRLLLGDSRGCWDGNTLVVDTTNFSDKTSFRESRSGLHLVERFTRTDANTIDYQFTIDDPATFTKAWSGEYPLVAAGPQDQIYEYACHEANYALEGILRGARAQEKEAAAATAKEGLK